MQNLVYREVLHMDKSICYVVSTNASWRGTSKKKSIIPYIMMKNHEARYMMSIVEYYHESNGWKNSNGITHTVVLWSWFFLIEWAWFVRKWVLCKVASILGPFSMPFDDEFNLVSNTCIFIMWPNYQQMYAIINT